MGGKEMEGWYQLDDRDGVDRLNGGVRGVVFWTISIYISPSSRQPGNSPCSDVSVLHLDGTILFHFFELISHKFWELFRLFSAYSLATLHKLVFF